MEVPHFFEAGPDPNPDQQEGDEAQEDEVVPVDPNQEQVESPQFIEVGPGPDPEQQQEDNASLEGELEKEDYDVPQDLQGGAEQGMEREQEDFQAVQTGSEPNLEEQQEIHRDVEADPEVEKQERIQQVLQGHVHLEINRMVDPEVRQEYETSVARFQLRQNIGPNIQQELGHINNNILQGNVVHLDIVPMTSEFLRPLCVEARREFLPQITTFQTEQVRFRITNISYSINIISQEFTAYQMIHRAILQLMASFFRMQFGTSFRLFVEALIRLLAVEGLSNLLSLEDSHSSLALEGPPVLLALEGPPVLLALEGPPRLLALEGPPLLPNLDGRSLFLTMEARSLLQTLYGRSLLQSMADRSFLPTMDGRSFLPTMDGRSFLPTMDGRSLLQGMDGRSLLQGMGGRSLLPTLVGRPLLPAQDNRPLLSALEERDSLLKKTGISEMQGKRDLVAQEPSERGPVCPIQPSEVLAVHSRKTKHNQRRRQQLENPFDPGQPAENLNPAELQKLLEYENQDVSDPGVPTFSDPRELLKDLNFGERKSDDFKMKPFGDLEMESIGDLKNELIIEPKTESEDSETEGNQGLETEGDQNPETEGDQDPETEGDQDPETEGDQDPETEGDEDPEMDDCYLFPSQSQRPIEEVIEIPEEPIELPEEPIELPEEPIEIPEEPIEIPEEPIEIPEEPDAGLPNYGENRPFHPNGRCRDGEADLILREQQLEERESKNYTKNMCLFTVSIFVGVLLLIGGLFALLHWASNKFGWRRTGTQNEPTLVTEMVFNATTQMPTSILNVTSSDYNITASMDYFSFNTTDMDI